MDDLRRALLLALLLAAPAASAYQERLILSAASGGCTLRLEADDEARALRLRVSPEGSRCRGSREAVLALLAAAFSKADPPRLEGTYRSLYVGRLVDHPWLAAQLVTAAAADGRWDRRRGKPVAMGTNAYVAMVLSTREIAGRLEAAVAASGYRIPSATVEKVLVGEVAGLREYDGPRPPGKLPFDAMVWFRLERGSARGP